MFGNEDTTYFDIRESSVHQWLEDMSKHEDIEVRGGINAVRGYIDSLNKKIKVLENKNAVKEKYMREMQKKR